MRAGAEVSERTDSWATGQGRLLSRMRSPCGLLTGKRLPMIDKGWRGLAAAGVVRFLNLSAVANGAARLPTTDKSFREEFSARL